MRSVAIRGVKTTIRAINKEMNKKHKKMVGVSRRIGQDLLRKARDNAPLQTGWLADSGSATTKDYGRGRGIVTIVGFDTPYAVRMHEARYQARPRMSQSRRETIWIGRDVTNDVEIDKGPTQFGSYGLHGKRGRKYLSRAWFDNRDRYRKRIQKAAEA